MAIKSISVQKTAAAARRAEAKVAKLAASKALIDAKELQDAAAAAKETRLHAEDLERQHAQDEIDGRSMWQKFTDWIGNKT